MLRLLDASYPWTTDSADEDVEKQWMSALGGAVFSDDEERVRSDERRRRKRLEV